MQAIDWQDLRFVLAVARCGTLAGAAKQLAVNETTVARRVARLEAQLGARLFERGQGILTPTDAGRRAASAAERVELQVQACSQAIAGTDQRAAGTVRVTSVPILVNRVLVPALPTLRRAHPSLQLELVAEPRDLSLTKREADIALRLARPRREHRALARRIGHLAYAVYGPAEHDGACLPWITYDDAMAALPQERWMTARRSRDGAEPPPLRVNDAEAVLQAVRAGLGKSLLPTAVAERLPGLVRQEPGPPVLTRELWLLVHPELRGLGRIQAVVEWLSGLAAKL